MHVGGRWRGEVTGYAPGVLCGLAFAGANGPATRYGRLPAVMTAEELSRLDLGGCELAVLSACETNVGVRRAGQGIASLQQALEAAGARSTITSLWKVPDEATRELMGDFYRRLWIVGKPKWQALRDAKTRMRKARRKDAKNRQERRKKGLRGSIASEVAMRASLMLVPGLIVLGTLWIDLVAGNRASVSMAIEIGALALVALGSVSGRRSVRALGSAAGPLLACGGSFLFHFVRPRNLDVYSLYGFLAAWAVAGIAVAFTLRRMTTTSFPRIFARLCILGLLLVTGLSLLEAVARRILPVNPYDVRPIGHGPRRLWVRDPLLGRRHVPGFRGRFVHPEHGGKLVEISEQGFRDRLIPERKPDGELRIVVLGDSQTFGLGVDADETFARLLEDRLGRSCRTLNAGVSATGTVDQVVQFEERLRAFSPDIVVVAFYAGNDLFENRASVARLRERGLLKRYLPSLEVPDRRRTRGGAGRRRRRARSIGREVEIPHLSSTEYWYRSSSLFRGLLDRIDLLLVRWGAKHAHAVYNQSVLQALKLDPSERMRRWLRLLDAAFRALRSSVERAGGRLVVMSIPVKIQTEPEEFVRLCRRLRIPRDEYAIDAIDRRIAQILSGLDVPFLDLLPLLQEHVRRGDDPYFLEGHLNRRGHLLAADALARFLLDEKLAAPSSIAPAGG